MPYDLSTGFDPVVGWTPVLSIYQADARALESNGNYDNTVPDPYKNDPYYSGNPIFPWWLDEAVDHAGPVSLDWEPYVEGSETPQYRENDPFYTNDLAALRPIKEMAFTLERIAQRCKASGTTVGLYDLVPLIYRNINRVRNLTEYDFNVWAKQQELIALSKVWNGLSLVDIINTLGGKFYFTAYLHDAGFDTNSFTRGIFRHYIKRLMSFYDGLGMDAVPLFTPNVGSLFISETLLLGLRDDAEAYQPGEWAVWAHSGSTTEGQWNTFVASLT